MHALFSSVTLCLKCTGQRTQRYTVTGKLAQNKVIDIRSSDEENALGMRFTLKQDARIECLYLDIAFKEPVKYWRHHTYEWITPARKEVSDVLSPKIVQLQNNMLVGAAKVAGAWEFDPAKPRILRWFIVHPMLNPLFQFRQNFREFHRSFPFTAGHTWELGLVSSATSIPEFSRSKTGFNATAILTDHCDFDQLNLLQKQRALFSKNGIKVTKGFFLLSDPPANKVSVSAADPEVEAELKQWTAEGHELAFHSLSNWLRPGENLTRMQQLPEANKMGDIHTWIDHGYHRYNYTKINLNEPVRKEWETLVMKNNIELIWTYVDTYDGTPDTLNQLDRTKTSILITWRSKGKYRGTPLQRPLSQHVRNILRYNTDERTVQFTLSLGTLAKNPKLRFIFPVLAYLVRLLLVIINPLSWFRLRSFLNRHAVHQRFSPTVFPLPHQPGLFGFQTLAIRDFAASFSEDSLAAFEQAKGVFIAHTYFSYTDASHPGRMFTSNNGDVAPAVEEAFRRLGKMIKDNTVWNPTVIEAKRFWESLMRMQLVPGGQLQWQYAPAALHTRDVHPFYE